MNEPNDRIRERIKHEIARRNTDRLITKARIAFAVTVIILAVIIAIVFWALASRAGADDTSSPPSNYAPSEQDCTRAETLRQAEYLTAYIGNRAGYEYAADIVYAAQAHGGTYGIDPFLVVAIAEVESGFRVNARGAAGELGLMQVHPGWLGEYPQARTLYGNVEAGCSIFAKAYHGDYVAALGYYNTGSRRNPPYERKVDAVYRELTHGYRLWKLRQAGR